MASYVKGALGYFSKEKVEEKKQENKPQEVEKVGYISWVTSGAYTVGSSTIGASVDGAKWIAGATYNAGSGIVSATGSAAAAVGASNVVSKVLTGKSKEHRD